MKIVFVSPWYPYPLANGSKIRIFQLLSSLAKRHAVHLLSFERNGEPVDYSGVQKLGIDADVIRWDEFRPYRAKALLGFFSPLPRSVFDTYHPETEKFIRKKIEEINPDMAIFSEMSTMIYHSGILAPSILDDFEISALRDSWYTENNPLRKLRRYLTLVKQRTFIKKFLPRFLACTVPSFIEKANLEASLPGYRNIRLIPNGVDLEYHRFCSTNPVFGKLIYLGSISYAANSEAVKYFMRDILPLIRKNIDEAHLVVTGSVQGADVSAFEGYKNLQLSGYLEDLRPTLASSWASIVPLKSGSGTRLKILESMALGVPVISTTKGAEGLNVAPEENILLGDDPDSFARQTIRLLKDRDLRQRLSKAGRKLVEEQYDWRQIGSQFVQLIEGMER